MSEQMTIDLEKIGMINPVRFRRVPMSPGHLEYEKILNLKTIWDTRRKISVDFIMVKRAFRGHYPCQHCGKDLSGEIGYKALDKWRYKWRLCRGCFATMMEKEG